MSDIEALGDQLVNRARYLGPEDEGIDVDDLDLSLDDIVGIKTRLSGIRGAIDIVNRALAGYWEKNFDGEKLEDEYTTWYVGRSKGKKFVDEDGFYEWMATLDAKRLKRLVSIGGLKVGGMNEGERETFLDESRVNDRISIQSKPRR